MTVSRYSGLAVLFSSLSLFARAEEIVVVSSEQVPSPLKSAVISLSQIDAADIEGLALQHPGEAFVSVPGMWVSRGDGQESLLSIRSPVLTGAGACGAFVVAEEGVAVRAPGFCNANQLFDTHIQQAGHIEVFRGPGSAIYGGNALFGGIDVRSPAISETPGVLSLAAGSQGYSELKLISLIVKSILPRPMF